MKIRRVRFTGVTPIPSLGRADDYTQEVQATKDRTVEAKVVDGIGFLEVRVAGHHVALIPLANVKSIETDEMAAAPAPAAKKEEVKPAPAPATLEPKSSVLTAKK